MVTRDFAPPLIGGIRRYSYEVFIRLREKSNAKIIAEDSGGRLQDEKNILRIKQTGNRLLDLIRFSFNAIYKTMTLDYDVLFGTTYFHGFVGIPAKVVRRKRLAVAIMDLGVIEKGLKVNPFIKFGKFLIHRVVVNFADIVVVPNKNLIKDLEIYFGVSGEKISYNPFGVDTSFFNPSIKQNVMKKRLKIDKKTAIIFFAGAIHPKKGLEYLVEASRELKNKYKRKNFRVVIAGQTEEKFNEYMNKLKTMIEKFGLEQNFIFSQDTGKELAYYYKDCDVYVAPSYYGEGLGMPCVEASAVGKPVVATNLFENTGAVINNYTGIIVEPQNAEKLAEALEKILENKKLAGKFGKNGIKHAKNFEWESHIERLIKTINK